MLKRTVDCILAVCVVVFSLPFLSIAALLVQLDSPGPAFFSQTRLGRGGKLFRIWKLRTMHVGSRGPGYTLGDDARVTRLGRRLRRSKLDELPQLWNVVVGDMSLVGPRPVIPELVEGFEQAYAQLLQVRPGLTDPATLKYCHEEECLSLVRDQNLYYRTVVIPDKVRLSAAYLQHSSLGRDLGLLVETMFALVPAGCRPGFVRARLSVGVNAVESQPIPGKV